MKKYKKEILFVVIMAVTAIILFASIGMIAGRIKFEINYADENDFISYQTSKWKYNITDFDKNKQAFETIAKWAKINFEKFLPDDSSYIEVFINDYNKLFYRISDQYGEYGNEINFQNNMTQFEQTCLNSVKESFNTGIDLERILVYKDRISLLAVKHHTYLDEYYAVVCMYNDEMPDFILSPNNYRNVASKKIQNNWYHVVVLP